MDKEREGGREGEVGREGVKGRERERERERDIWRCTVACIYVCSCIHLYDIMCTRCVQDVYKMCTCSMHFSGWRGVGVCSVGVSLCHSFLRFIREIE